MGAHQHGARWPRGLAQATGRRNGTRELSHSLALIRATPESTTDDIFVIDCSQRVADFNDNFVELWQIPRPLSRESMMLGCSRRYGGSVHSLSTLAETSRASQRPLPSTLDIVELAEGRVCERRSQTQRVDGRNGGRVWTFRNVTEARRVEEERRELLESERAARTASELLSAIEDQFATLSHELRTPLNAILGRAQILRRAAREPAALQTAGNRSSATRVFRRS